MADRDSFQSSTTKIVEPMRLSLSTTLFLAFSLLAIIGLPGCSGCMGEAPPTDDPEGDRKKLAKKKPKEDFDRPELKVLPHDDRPSSNFIKPGHWANASNRLKANNFDFRGELFAQTTNKSGQAVEIAGTDYQFASNRPIALPKGQERWSDVTYFVPRVGNAEDRNRWFSCRLRSRGGGRDTITEVLPTTRLFAHQFYVVVLASTADDFQFINTLDSTKPLVSFAMSPEDKAPHYRVVFPKVIDRVPLPENSLTWTSIAYIVWDDIDPSVMSIDQQQAMIDWLHWGGQLIVSGPSSLDTLKLSFLADYLPAVSEGNLELEQARFDEWNQVFVQEERVMENNRRVPRRFEIDVKDGPVRGVELKLNEGSDYVANTGELIAERRLGRGRIAVTAFQLKDPRICKNWKNFDNLWNNAILRRPPRKFVSNENAIETIWDDGVTVRNDSRLVSNLRYISRDLSDHLSRYTREDQILLKDLGYIVEPEPVSGTNELVPDVEVVDETTVAQPKRIDLSKANPLGGFVSDEESGVAGWNDYSGAAVAARQCLQDASGISIPDSAFILRTTAIYLLVLVPVNWLFFWMIGRVEWAWIAAPAIAIFGALSVIKLAELDIGFARSRTEIGIMEVQEGYHRAHVSRFTSLYSSLSTGYELEFDQPSALALPLARGRNQISSQHGRFSSGSSTVQFQQEGSSVSLSGFQVSSNSTGMVHSEYMLPLASEAIFQWETNEDGTTTLIYGGDLPIQDVGIIRRVGDRFEGEIEVAWIGKLEPGAELEVTFAKPDDTWSLFDQWNQSRVFSPNLAEADVSLRHLLNVAKDVRQLKAGDVRLVGWTDQDVKGLQITPEAPQSTLRTLVVGHLKHCDALDPISDKNTRRVDGIEPEKQGQGILEEIENL